MLEHQLCFDEMHSAIAVRYPSDDEPLIGIVWPQSDGTFLAEMAGIGQRLFNGLDLAQMWCLGVLDGASGGERLC